MSKGYNNNGALDGVTVTTAAHEEMLRHGTPRYVGIWHGGGGYVAPSWQDDTELFYTLEHARLTLLGRYHNSGSWFHTPLTLTWGLDGGMYEVGTQQKLDTPGVGEGSSLILAPIGTLRDALEDGYYSHVLAIGPRGGLHETRV